MDGILEKMSQVTDNTRLKELQAEHKVTGGFSSNYDVHHHHHHHYATVQHHHHHHHHAFVAPPATVTHQHVDPRAPQTTVTTTYLKTPLAAPVAPKPVVVPVKSPDIVISDSSNPADQKKEIQNIFGNLAESIDDQKRQK